jgi:hypothetical protein
VITSHSNISRKVVKLEAVSPAGPWHSQNTIQIEYLPGKSNLLGDALSRLVAIETEHIAEGTRPRQTAELASFFPEVHSEIAWQATNGLLELESSAAENKANETIHFSDRDVDFREHGLGRYEDTHESILYYQANVQHTFIEITENDYKLCPDFGSIYKKLYEPKECESAFCTRKSSFAQGNSKFRQLPIGS